MQTYGRVDVMLNNAGLMPQAPLEARLQELPIYEELSKTTDGSF